MGISAYRKAGDRGRHEAGKNRRGPHWHSRRRKESRLSGEECPMPCEACQRTRPKRNPGPRGGLYVAGVSARSAGPAIPRDLGTACALEESTRRPVNGPGKPRPHPAAGHGRNLKNHPDTFGLLLLVCPGSAAGGHRAAILYSIVVTCRLNGLDPFVYLRDVIDRLTPARIPPRSCPRPGKPGNSPDPPPPPDPAQPHPVTHTGQISPV